MNSHPFSGSTLNTVIAALVGGAAAAVVKLLLDESPKVAWGNASPRLRTESELRAMVRRAKLRELSVAAHDPCIWPICRP